MRLTFYFQGMESMTIILIVFILLDISFCKDVDYNYLLGAMQSKIVGGVPVSIESYPYAVLVFNMGGLCGGTILNSWTVLSAAHCFDFNKDVSDITIHAGSKYRYDSNADIYQVSDVISHEDYNKAMPFACDISLIFVGSPIQFSNKVQRAIIVNNNKWMNKHHKNFTVFGWGMTAFNGPLSNEGLLMTKLRFVPLVECGKMHDLDFSPDMFCLYGDARHDTCKGDSGGGVLWHGMLVGIVSHGDGCAGLDRPSVYSNVWYFREWIRNTIVNYFDNNCKSKG